MFTTKVFKSGNSQAIRIPKEYQVDAEEVFINKIGNTIIISPKNDPWRIFKESLDDFSDDYFFDGRNQPKMQKRKIK
jgi:antitoxin VapB